MNTRKRRRRAGFTLLEVLLVLVIIGILAAIVAPQFFGIQQDAEVRATKSQIELFKQTLQRYRLGNSLYPASDQGLQALITQPTSEPLPRNWAGPYLENKSLVDPWGNAYQYRYPGEHGTDEPEIWSFGPDRQGGTQDDIVSWTTS